MYIGSYWLFVPESVTNRAKTDAKMTFFSQTIFFVFPDFFHEDRRQWIFKNDFIGLC